MRHDPETQLKELAALMSSMAEACELGDREKLRAPVDATWASFTASEVAPLRSSNGAETARLSQTLSPVLGTVGG